MRSDSGAQGPAARPEILFCHLGDDRSGSPRMLVQSLRALADRWPRRRLFAASRPVDGFLAASGLPVQRYAFRGNWRHPWLALSFLWGQASLFLQLAAARPERHAIVYVNTLLPAGAAAFGALTRRPVLFHSHELPSSRLEHLLFRFTLACSSLVVCVSQAHAQRLPVPPGARAKLRVVPNALDPVLARTAFAAAKQHRSDGIFHVLFATSYLLPHKGIAEFVRLAHALAHRTDIRLHLSCPAQDRGILPAEMPANVSLWLGGGDLERLYALAGLALNLSRPDLVAETFGLTVAEAMAFGTPVVVPPVGGPAEQVRDGVEGYTIDSRQTESLAAAVQKIADDPDLWGALSRNARVRARAYSFEAYRERLVAVADELLPPAA